MAELTFFKIAKRNKGLSVALACLLIAAIVINFATGVNFFKLSNLLNVTRSFCILGIASLGQAIVIISGSGGLDLSIGNGSSFGIPNLFFVFLIIVIAASILLNSTGYGRRLYAVGTNRAAATLNGYYKELAKKIKAEGDK